jgi:hypothetical protein
VNSSSPRYTVLYRVIQSERPRSNNYKTRCISPMKMKVGNTRYFAILTRCLFSQFKPFRKVYDSKCGWIIFENIQCPFGLTIQPEENQLLTSSVAQLSPRTRELISLWLYKKTTSYGIKKNVFTLHSPPELHTLMTSNPSKKNSFGCAANRKIGKAKDLSVPLRIPSYALAKFLSTGK